MIENILPEGEQGIRVMVIVTLILISIALPIAVVVAKQVFEFIKSEKESLKLLTEKSIETDRRLEKTDTRIEFLMQEMQRNRVKDIEDTVTNRALIAFVAKQTNVQIPEFK